MSGMTTTTSTTAASTRTAVPPQNGNECPCRANSTGRFVNPSDSNSPNSAQRALSSACRLTRGKYSSADETLTMSSTQTETRAIRSPMFDVPLDHHSHPLREVVAITCSTQRRSAAQHAHVVASRTISTLTCVCRPSITIVLQTLTLTLNGCTHLARFGSIPHRLHRPTRMLSPQFHHVSPRSKTCCVASDHCCSAGPTSSSMIVS